MRRPKKITVGKLKEMLSEYDDHCEINLSCDLHIEELKYIGGGQVYIKIAEPAARLGARFRAAFPEVEAVFFWPKLRSPEPLSSNYLVLP